MAGSGDSDSRIPPGTRLNGIYIVERRIAVGGMGEIYAGRAAETGVPVAIKMIRPELAADPNVIALFRREALALHQLRHEAIVAYYVFSIDPALNAAYLAMEFVPGRSLSDMVREGPLGFEFVRILQKRVAAGLQAAHKAGLVHRDVSSDNILLPDGDPARAKIIDFGIAKNKLDKSTIIGDGFAGKNSYISPEQLGMFGGEVSAKSDVYSLGLVLAEALLGRKIDMGGNLAEVVAKRESPPDLTGVDRRMLPLLREMLDPDPERRPAMDDVATREVTGLTPAEALARDATIAQEISRRAVIGQNPSPPPQKTRPALVVGGSALAAALIAAIGYMAWSNAGSGPAPRAGEPLTTQAQPPTLSGSSAAAQEEQNRARERAEAAERQRQADLAAAEQRRTAQQQAEAAERQRQADLAAAEQRRIAQQQAETAERQRQADLAAAEQRRAAQEQAAAAERQRQADLAALAAAEQRRSDQARDEQAQRDREAERLRLASQAIAEQQRQARERAEQADRVERERRASELETQRRLESEAEAARRPPQLASRGDAASPLPGMRDCTQCPELVTIPEGVMRMGSNRDPSERPIRPVTVKPFVMSRYPVTVGQWRECVRAGGCPDLGGGDDRRPVNNVSADDAARYVAWLSKATGRSYRLPSEAEWEYAARAGTETRYWWGEEFSEDHAACRKCGASHADPLPVGQFKPNAFGLFDMTGSVGQWVSDCWHRDYRGAPRDASSWGPGRCREQVVRGGSWTSDPADQTVTSRSFYDPSVRHPSYGLRVVRGL